MKPLFAFAILLMVTPVQAATPSDDAPAVFQRMCNAGQLKKGMNLILTYRNGHKLWANLKAEGNGHASVEWIISNAAGKTIPSVLVKSNSGPRAAEYPGKCYRCVKSPSGPASDDSNCHEIPCPVHVPCCNNNGHDLWCCIH